MIVFGIDPGSKESGIVMLESEKGFDWTIKTKSMQPNQTAKLIIQSGIQGGTDRYIAIEKIVSYNQKVGASVFDTVKWVGRFMECWENEPNCTQVKEIPRREAVGHLCEFGKSGSDKYVREALIKRFGKEVLKGFTNHTWSALAIAVTFIDKYILGGKKK